MYFSSQVRLLVMKMEFQINVAFAMNLSWLFGIIHKEQLSQGATYCLSKSYMLDQWCAQLSWTASLLINALIFRLSTLTFVHYSRSRVMIHSAKISKVGTVHCQHALIPVSSQVKACSPLLARPRVFALSSDKKAWSTDSPCCFVTLFPWDKV